MALAFLLFLEADAFLGGDSKLAGALEDAPLAAGDAIGLQEKTVVVGDAVMLATE
jgi:hypothetical protein